MFVRLFKHIETPLILNMIPSLKQLHKPKYHKDIMIELKENNFKNYYETRAYRQYKPNWDKK